MGVTKSTVVAFTFTRSKEYGYGNMRVRIPSRQLEQDEDGRRPFERLVKERIALEHSHDGCETAA